MLNSTNSEAPGNFRRNYSSNHVGGAQFLMGDGAVRFISENVDHNIATATVDSTMERLMSREDGQVVGDF